MAAYRILSLDGGGSWALIEVMALQAIYGNDCRGYDVLRNFDLVAANSGGSIVLGGLLTNKPLSKILGFFLEQEARAKVFERLPFDFDFDSEGRPLRSVWNQTLSYISPVGAKYRTTAKLAGLCALLEPTGNETLHELHKAFSRSYNKSIHFLICAFDYDRKRAKFFRSNSQSLAGSVQPKPIPFIPLAEPKKDATLAEAIHASTNAPVKYFVEPATFGGERYWDGAIAGYNNPILPAVVEAMANRRHGAGEPGDIQVLSIGTGTVSLPPDGKDVSAEDPRLLQHGRGASTLFGDVGMLATSILDDPPDSATFTVHVILGQPLPDPNGSPKVAAPVSGTVVRMSPLVRPVRSNSIDSWRPPDGLDADTFSKIADLDLDVIDEKEIGYLKKLGELWIAGKIRNQAIRENKYFDVQIGHATFAEARKAWLRLSGMAGWYPG